MVAHTKPIDEVEVFPDVKQGTDEWRRLRAGIVTSSVMRDVMASGKNGDDSKMREKLLNRLAGEIVTGEPAEEGFSSFAMERGKLMEEEAREHYAFTRGVDLHRIGFVRRTLANGLVVGCSPDSLIGDDTVLEIKTMKPELLIPLARRGTFPSEHRAQCHGSLWVTGRSVCRLVVYYRGMPIMPTFRIERDDAYIRELSEAVEVFYWELNKLVAWVRSRSD